MLLFFTSSSLNLYKGDATASWVKDTYRKGEKKRKRKREFLCSSNNINYGTLFPCLYTKYYFFLESLQSSWRIKSLCFQLRDFKPWICETAAWSHRVECIVDRTVVGCSS